MKTLKWSLLCLFFSALLFAGSAFASGPDEKLRDKIMDLIEKPDLSGLSGSDRIAEVEFVVNGKDQIVVTMVRTHNPFLEQYIKQQLNYRTVRIEGVKHYVPYHIKMMFAKES